MSRQLPSLLALKAFEAAARRLSFTLAAEELHVTQGAISRHVKSLETQLGVTLFRRRSRGLELTPEGASYLPVLRDCFDRIEVATQQILHRRGQKVLTVSVLPTLAVAWLIPRLADFNAVHPAIEVHMVTSILPADFRSGIDMAIRVGRPGPEIAGSDKARIDLVMTEDWSGLASEFLMPDFLIPVCSPLLLQSAPVHEPADLVRHTLLHNATRPKAWEDWLHAVGVTCVDPDGGPAYGHFFMVLQAARQGRGLACVPSVLVADDLASGRLVSPFPQPVESAGAYHVLFRRQDASSPEIGAFRTWLVAEAREFSEQIRSQLESYLPASEGPR